MGWRPRRRVVRPGLLESPVREEIVQVGLDAARIAGWISSLMVLVLVLASVCFFLAW